MVHQKKVDYTNTFCHLMDFEIKKDKIYKDNDFQNWKKRWQERLKINNNTPDKYIKLMRSVNPLVIPRNHKVEESLNEVNKGNIKPLNQLLEILKRPYVEQENTNDYQIPSKFREKYQTFCGT